MRRSCAKTIQVAGIESIQDASGHTYTYDVNTNTNYNSDAEAAAEIRHVGTGTLPRPNPAKLRLSLPKHFSQQSMEQNHRFNPTESMKVEKQHIEGYDQGAQHCARHGQRPGGHVQQQDSIHSRAARAARILDHQHHGDQQNKN